MKKVILFLATLFLTINAFALPGFTPFFQDESGEFVYYRDYTFSRESYVGFLCYDDATYQMRYYAPFDKEQNLPEKEVCLLISLNPASDYIDMTGERFLTEITSDDTDIVNYLHDLMYEFNARRSKELDVTPYSLDYVNNKSWWENGYKSSQDFEQFGGSTIFYFDVMIPLFNIKKILNNKNEELFRVATTGRILSSGDNTFNDFRGFNNGLTEGQSISDKKSKTDKSTLKIKKNAKKTDYSFDPVKVTLDANWTASADNMWWLDNKAYLTVSNLPKSTMRTAIYLFYLNRRLIQSSQNTYIDFRNLELSSTSEGFLKLYTETYQPATKDKMVSVKFISTTENDDVLNYIVFSAWEIDYSANKKYFDNILKTIKQ